MTEEIRSFLRLCLLYLIALLVACVVTVAIGGTVNAGARLPFTHLPISTEPGPPMLTFREAAQSDPVDILFIGSSHSYRTFDPRFFDRFGLKTFNLGSSEQTPFSTYHVVPRYLDRLKPKLVVLEVFGLTMQSSGIEGALILVNNLPLSSDLVRLSIATGELRVVNSLVARGARELVSPYADWEATLMPSDEYVGRGFVEKDAAYRREAAWKWRRFVPTDLQLTYQSRLVKLLRDRGSEVVVVVVPIPTESLDRIQNYSEFDSIMRSWAARDSVPYIDFNKTMKLPRSEYFFDSHHLNQRGVLEFLASMHAALCDKSLWKPVDARCEHSPPHAGDRGLDPVAARNE